jgi:homospermidine synthase
METIFVTARLFFLHERKCEVKFYIRVNIMIFFFLIAVLILVLVFFYLQPQIYVPINFVENILIIGFGAVAIATMPALFKHMAGLTPDRITIITADDRNESVAAEYNIRHIIKPIKKDNINFIREYLKPGDLILNLSVDVDSISVARISQEIGCLYLDTCIEPWDDMYKHENVEVRTNYYDRLKGLELKKEGMSPTVLFSMGANPGLISGKTAEDKYGWSDIAQSLGVKVIHVAEQDTQVPKKSYDKNTFVNTWSVDGFISEAVFQPAECGWGTHELSMPADAKQHSDLSSYADLNVKSALYFDKPGGALWVNSWTPYGRFVGHMVTHNESISIAEYLGSENYRPTVYYAYKPIDAANDAIDVILENGGKIQEKLIVLKKEEIAHGFDELGALVFTDKTAYWYGSRVDLNDVYMPHTNPTTMQVVGGIMAGIKWMVDNPKEGVVEADEIPLEYMDVARPYLGKLYGKRCEWMPKNMQLSSFRV